MISDDGAIAQLGERYNGIVEVRGSIPRGSTNKVQGLRILIGSYSHGVPAIQAMGVYPWASRKVCSWAKALDDPLSAKLWEDVLREHPEFFDSATKAMPPCAGDAPTSEYTSPTKSENCLQLSWTR